MKLHLSLVIIVCALFAVNAEGQTSGPQRMRAKIPFAFNVGEKSLAAGEYTLTVINPASDRKVVQIRSLDGRSRAIVQTTLSRGSLKDQAKLVFHRYGDRYFFAEIDVDGDGTTLVAALSRAERATRRALNSKEMTVRVNLLKTSG